MNSAAASSSNKTKEDDVSLHEINMTDNKVGTTNNDIDKDDKSKKKNKKEKPQTVAFYRLFRFATKWDFLMLVIGIAGSIGNGVMMPLMMLVFTSIIDNFSSYQYDACNATAAAAAANSTTSSGPDLMQQMRDQALYLVYLGLGTMFFSYFHVAFCMMPAEKQALTMRQRLFEAIVRQDIGWFDTYKSGELTNRLTDDINKVKDGIGDKMGNCIQYLTTFLGGLILSFVKGWKLTLVMLSISPLLIFAGAIMAKLMSIMTTYELKAYSKAGSVAEEVFTAIRTVFAFNGAQKEHRRYVSKLTEARKFGIRKAILNGAMQGFLWLVINSSYALAFWYGWTLTRQEDYTVGKVLLVFFNIIIALFSLGSAAPYLEVLASSKAAAFEVFRIIDRVPPIDFMSKEGKTLESLRGDISFNKVNFSYPSRSQIPILRDLTFRINAGSTVALVGSSGCGKSTCIQLLQRFYDPASGTVTLDDRVPLTEINVDWLRQQIGVVNQEPILFGTSIAENIRLGAANVSGTDLSDITQEQVEQAAKNANAHDFIMTLPEKYDTLVGDRGGQLSGGQKQRIAIARALIRNPRILLLDEATSALDYESERIVQSALDRARVGRTTVIVAHRLSTIRNADVIFAFDAGQIVEYGTHEELMAKKGLYYSLVINQQHADEEQDADGKKTPGLPKAVTDAVVSPTRRRSTLTVDKEGKIVEKIVDIDEDPNQKKKKKEDKPSMLRVLKLNKPEWYFILIGCVAAVISGAIRPAFSYVFAKVIGVFSLCSKSEQEYWIMVYCLLFISFGILTFCSNLIQNWMFGLSGENLTMRLRSDGFKAMLRQEIGWFDEQNNNVGTLCTRLAVETAAIQGATGIRIGFILQVLSNLGIGLVLSLVFGWPIALTILGFVPFMIISGALQTKMLHGFSKKDKEVLEEAGKISYESISNIRTVTSLGKQGYFVRLYKEKIKVPFKAAIRSINLFAIMLGFTASLIYYANAAAYGLGAYLVQNKLFDIDLQDIFLVIGCILFGAQNVGQVAGMMPDYAKAQMAIVNFFALFDRKTKINNWEPEPDGKKLEDTQINEIKFSQVHFQYPTRADAKVLRGLDLTVKRGQKVALVGSSGCGKSTVMQLLERFYDPVTGTVTLGAAGNEVKLTDLDLHWLRNQMAIVSQEPVLFDMSIAENISYGGDDYWFNMDEIMAAARKANIHDFITKLPDGYNTNVGSRGTQLSGGQKQRIAIARALIRNPKILLLDEATSALDNESERIVQEAIEIAQEGRTSITIAHKLTTVVNSDTIFVFREGRVAEQGTHGELMNQNGIYASLNSAQQREKRNAK